MKIVSKAAVPAIWCAVQLLGFGLGAAQAQPTQATREDSGWVSIFNGTTIGSDYYVYSGGYIDIGAQTQFKVENGMIHAGGPYALLITNKEYGFYRIRIDYRFGAGVGGSGNAGMMILMDNQGAKTAKSLRPRSIEINCRRDTDYPWTLWSSSGLGPVMATTVKQGTAKYLAKGEGGVAYTVDPSGNRTLESAYANPELPVGQWNHGEAEVYGDSGMFFLNGHLRTASWHWTVNQGGKSVRTARGGVGVQSEGFDIWYRDWQIQELDSATHLPLHARRGCTDAKSPKYDPRAVVPDGSCAASSITQAQPAVGAKSATRYASSTPVFARSGGTEVIARDAAGRMNRSRAAAPPHGLSRSSSSGNASETNR